MRYEAIFQGFKRIASPDADLEYKVVVEEQLNRKWRCYIPGGGELGTRSKGPLQAKVIAESNFTKQLTEWTKFAK